MTIYQNFKEKAELPNYSERLVKIKRLEMILIINDKIRILNTKIMASPRKSE